MAKIVSITPGYYRLPLAEALSDSMHGTVGSFEINTVRVRDADGAEGVGYGYVPGRNGAAINAILRYDVPDQLVGQDADRIEHLWHKLWWGQHYGGRGGPAVLAQSIIDIALWDLKATKAGMPLWRLLGGNDPVVDCYVGGIDLDFPLDKLLAQTDGNLAKGYRAIKMKVGRARLAEDVARVRAMREHLGDDFPLMVDANMKWSVDEAVRAARALREFDLTWIEEPIDPENVAGHRRVLQEGGTPIATGENLRTLWEFRQLVTEGGVTFPEPDVVNCGGVTPFMKIAHLAEAFSLPVTSHGVQDVSIHLLAALHNRSYMEVHDFGLQRFMRETVRIENGRAVAPERPGHGVALDWDALARIAV
ncbi:mandelate racemase/muconate lactonizing enzyme family protein [Variovorax sp. LT1R16]|uniref:mandelate racemase/muconate lactonizing enzyme family protein n=1 Tax=Variovorax sp. LT1R16 TaxID=3443728 RepID=UPI003F45248E